MKTPPGAIPGALYVARAGGFAESIAWNQSVILIRECGPAWGQISTVPGVETACFRIRVAGPAIGQSIDVLTAQGGAVHLVVFPDDVGIFRDARRAVPLDGRIYLPDQFPPALSAAHSPR